jgi:hypothetical protein
MSKRAVQAKKDTAPKMEAIKEIPSLQFSVLCDNIKVEPGSNKPNFVGVFSLFVRPGIVPQFFQVNRWIDGIGKYRQVTQILSPDLSQYVRTEEITFELKDRTQTHDVINRFQGLNFEKPGVYWVQILLDGEPTLSYPLPVLEG